MAKKVSQHEKIKAILKPAKPKKPSEETLNKIAELIGTQSFILIANNVSKDKKISLGYLNVRHATGGNEVDAAINLIEDSEIPKQIVALTLLSK